MSKLDEIELIPRHKIVDECGWFLKIITGHEDHLPQSTGEVYVTLSYPGQVRGNHYHPLTAEWLFTVILGEAEVVLSDVQTGEVRSMTLNADKPVTLYIPAGVGYAFKNPETATAIMIFAMYADRLYDPDGYNSVEADVNCFRHSHLMPISKGNLYGRFNYSDKLY